MRDDRRNGVITLFNDARVLFFVADIVFVILVCFVIVLLTFGVVVVEDDDVFLVVEVAVAVVVVVAVARRRRVCFTMSRVVGRGCVASERRHKNQRLNILEVTNHTDHTDTTRKQFPPNSSRTQGFYYDA